MDKMWRGVVVAAITSVCPWLAAADITSLDLSACSASIHLSVQTQGTQPALLDKPDAAWVVRLQPGARAWQLQCEPVVKGSTGESSSSSVQINRAIGPGAVAIQNIGGQQRAQAAPSQPLRVAVPSGWQLLARRWSGELLAKNGVWQIDMELAAGSVVAPHVRDSSVVVDAGTVQIGQAQGNLHAHVRGAGSVEVAQMQQVALDVQLSGAGQLQFKGSAASARVRASGAGSIDIEHVATEPQVQVSGAVTIDIGR